ncbi:hypothetical protein [Vibrio methylphosphonaticus]|uniref:hypothetical protein n=1 Tax=Vibrio methylphosphonaticus TaxID=2946866 RepID=UPI00202A87BA|nr:hypothetical protein [Vibrio methylphosphonaticus]MCL9776145.1 hypothetical protein [Vibrio methylphosphonaticus]
MGEKTTVPAITETIEIDGVYYVEQREYTERRTQRSQRVFYERRSQPDPRTAHIKHIDEEV